jgi:hypothetical protein
MTPPDAHPIVLPFTRTDYLTVRLYRPRFAIAGGHLSISGPEDCFEVGIVKEPRSHPEAADWMFWRTDNGVQAERLANGTLYLAADMRGLLDNVLSEWSTDGKRCTEPPGWFTGSAPFRGVVGAA